MKAKKALGQHFLINETITAAIAAELSMLDTVPRVLEVGPGKGVLTKYLLEKNAAYKAVELDHDMIEFLSENFPGIHEKIIHKNFLKLSLDQVYNGLPFLLIGNYPYNISSQIVFKMIEYRHLIPEMVGMFQKEMAHRIIATEGNKTYGVISVLVQIFYEGTLVFDVTPDNFSPPPKVNSTVIKLTRKIDIDPNLDYSFFKQIVKNSFGQRRKMLRNTLKSIVVDKSILEEDIFKQRPEQLSVTEFIALTYKIKEHNESRTKNISRP